MTKVKLGDVAIERKQLYSGNKDNIPNVGLEHLTPNEVRLSHWNINVDNTFTKGFTKGQILLGRRRAYLKKAVVAPFDGICSGDITTIEAIPNKIHEDLLPFIIQNDRFFDYATKGSAGSLSPRVKWEYLKEYEFDLPPIKEQERLAQLLWAAYELKESYKKLIVATDEMVRAQFIEMFGREQLTRLDECSVITMGSSPDSKYYNSLGIGLPFYQGRTEFGDIFINNTEQYCSVPQRTACKDDILMSVRAPVGCVNIATQKCCIGRGIASIRAKQDIINSLFLFWALRINEKNIENLGVGSTFKAINKDVVLGLLIPLSKLGKQNKFVSIAQQADKSKAELQQSIKKIDDVMKSLLP